MVGVVMAFICGAALTLFGTPYAIRVLVRLGWRQVVRADGPTTRVSYTSPETLAARYGFGLALAQRLAAIEVLTDAVINDQ